MQEATSSRSVLIVDDDETVRLLLRKAFQAKGWRVDDAYNSWHAGEAIAQAGKPYTAIVVDVVMPGTNGIEFVKALKAAQGDRGSIIGFVTGSAGDDLDAALREVSPAFVYRKPFNPGDLIDRLSHLLGK